MDALQRLREMPVIGNAYSDRELFDLAHEVVMDSSRPDQERFESLQHMDRAMGTTPLDLSDEAACWQAMSDYLREFER